MKMQKRRRSSTKADRTAFLSNVSSAERFVLKSCRANCSWFWASCLPACKSTWCYKNL